MTDRKRKKELFGHFPVKNCQRSKDCFLQCQDKIYISELLESTFLFFPKVFLLDEKNHTTSIFLDSYPIQGHMKAGVPTAHPLYSQWVATVDRSTCFDLAHVYAECLPDARDLCLNLNKKIFL